MFFFCLNKQVGICSIVRSTCCHEASVITDYFHLTFGQYPQDFTSISAKNFIIPLLPKGGGGYTVLPLSVLPSVLPSVQDIFRRIFLSNY